MASNLVIAGVAQSAVDYAGPTTLIGTGSFDKTTVSLQVSADGGTTWAPVGQFGSPFVETLDLQPESGSFKVRAVITGDDTSVVVREGGA